MGFKINLWSILSCVFMVYIANSVYHLYKIYFPSRCLLNSRFNGDSRHGCLNAALDPQREKLLLTVYLSTTGRSSSIDFRNVVLRKEQFDMNSDFEEPIQIDIPKRTLENGTLWLHAFLGPVSQNSYMDDPRRGEWYVERKSMITSYMTPRPETINLMKTQDSNKKSDENSTEQPMSHLRSIVTLLGVGETFPFFWNNVPGEIVNLLQLNDKQRYLPIFTIEELHYRIRDLEKIEKSSNKMNITIRYQSTSIGKLRLLSTAKQSTESLKSLGFTDKDIDEVKGIFTDTNFYFLALTFFVAAIHLLLDFLAFKNDISFWRNRKTMVGISTKTLIWRFFSQTIVFVYLLDENTSLLVLIPTGLGVVIELWKLGKAFKVTVDFGGRFGMPRIRFGLTSKQEQETADFDAQGMHYLVYILTPLCIGGAVYSLLYVPHKSWYSWFVQSLANAVYAFGFLFMLPQLFINYKLKSVAHLPWRAFMYKAFNTFIDDMFAFIISMPTAHRVACFRDDVVFVVYLYQRYLYPVDKSRINEFGECFDNEKENKKTK